MKKNILIDTCVLRELISPVEFSGYLKQIQYWNDEGLINVLAPPTLVQEWNKHKEKEGLSIKQKLKNHTTTLKQSILFEQVPYITDAQLNAAEKLLLSQIDTLDKIITGADNLDEESSASIMWKHKQASKAPFHVKKDSDNDAVIIFSAIQEVKRLNEEEIIIISSNHSDFSTIGDKSIIHPDISNEFPEIKITYYYKLSDAIDSLIQSGLPSIKEGLHVGKQLKVYFPVDPNASSLKQLLSYLNRRFSDINFLPRIFFSSHPPIIINTKNEYSETPFLLNTDNEDLFEIFSNAKVNENYKKNQDFKDISTYLRHNLVYGFKYKSDKIIEVPYLDDRVCDCEMCQFRQFKISNAIKLINSSKELEPNLKNAKVQYLLGNIENSINTLKQIEYQALEEKKFLTYYITIYNLKLLKRHLDYNFMNKNETLSKIVGEINLDDTLIKSKVDSINDILEYIHNGNYWKTVNDKFSKILDNIKAQQIDNVGGWSDYLKQFLECYFETVYFIEENFIFMDDFSELSSFTSKFIDGLFASYSCSDELEGRLIEINDVILEKLVRYGKTDDIIKFQKRYGINIINYSPGEGNRIFLKQFVNLLDSYSDIHYEDLLKDQDGAFLFWPRFRRMILNAVTLSGIIKLDKSEINLLAEKILEFLNVQKHINEFEINKSISFFLNNHCSMISQNILEGYFKYSILQKENNNDFLKFTLKNICRSNHIRFNFGKNEWSMIRSKYFTNNEKCRIDDICILNSFLANKSYKEEIKKFISNVLNEKFDTDVYYHSVLDQIISETPDFSNKYESEILKYTSNGKRARLFPGNYYTDNRIDEYINFCFSFNKSIPDDIKKNLKILDKYYEWILDIDNYNYETFNTNWLFVHPTKFYYKMFKKSLKLKKWMKIEAMNSTDNRIAKLYLQLYTPNWGSI